MKNVILLLCVVVPVAVALDTKTNHDVPAFAAEWRVTGIIRQGEHAQASMERTGVRSRFVKDGDHLPGDITVVGVNYEERSVTITNGKETAVLHAGHAMAPALPPPKSITMVQQEQLQAANKSQAPQSNASKKATMTRDANGNWIMQYGDGRSMDMQTYAQRYGGLDGAMTHVQERMQSETDPERLAMRKQQLKALKAMRKAEQQ